MTRYYLHGDQSEEDKGIYYCASCDLFTDKYHFEDNNHSATNKEYYDNSVNNWKVISKKKGVTLQRPDKPLNLFSHLPKPATSRFYCWLKKQRERDDPISDLAQDALADSKFPSNTNSLSLIKNYLFKKSAYNELIQALIEAHAEFNNKKSRSGLTLSLRFKVFRNDNYQCQICGATAKDGSRLEVDHKIPVAKGGSGELSNLWTLYFNCNRGKGAKNL